MPNYIRPVVPGGCFFFTVVTHERRPLFGNDAGRELLISTLKDVIAAHPFDLRAMVVLPDHLHLLLKLPEYESDYSLRLGLLKVGFTREYLKAGGTEGRSTHSRRKHRVRGVWQKRFYDHAIRDYRDYKAHLDYIHMNPVKHGLAKRAADWPWSTFRKYVEKGEYDLDWCGPIHLPGGFEIIPDEWA